MAASVGEAERMSAATPGWAVAAFSFGTVCARELTCVNCHYGVYLGIGMDAPAACPGCDSSSPQSEGRRAVLRIRRSEREMRESAASSGLWVYTPPMQVDAVMHALVKLSERSA